MKNLVDLLHVSFSPHVVAHVLGGLEVLGQLRLLKSFIFKLALVLASDGSVATAFAHIVFFGQKVCEVGGVHIRSDLLEHLF